MADVETRHPRPLSPHLQVFRPILTMVMSILHRITGVGLYIGTLLLAWWLVALATSDAAFATAQGFFGSWFGLLILFGYSWALLHHAIGGIRHFVWDLGYGFDLRMRNLMAQVTIAGSLALTVILWIAVLVVA